MFLFIRNFESGRVVIVSFRSFSHLPMGYVHVHRRVGSKTITVIDKICNCAKIIITKKMES